MHEEAESGWRFGYLPSLARIVFSSRLHAIFGIGLKFL
jgi:hypothetical protein